MKEMIELWEKTGRPWKEEYTLSLYIDKMGGGWKGIDNYRKYDPIFYQMSLLYPDKDKKKLIFGHFNNKVIRNLIGNGKNVKERIDLFGANL